MYRLSLTAGTLMATAAILFGGVFAYAEHGDNDDDDKKEKKEKNEDSNPAIQALQENIKKLKQQLEDMMKQKKDLMQADLQVKKQLNEDKKDLMQSFGDMDLTKKQLKFVRSLVRGMKGDDVKDLQELLAQDPDIFDTSNITGFFGPLTEAAVKKWQKKHGIESIGIFGPKSQAKILALFVGKPLPPGIAKKLGLENSSTTPGAGFVTVCHKPSGSAQQTLVIPVPALGGHLGHGDTVGICAGGTGTTTPPTDTSAPILSSIASSVGTSTATITWSTNENSTSDMWYGTLTSYGSSSTNASMVMSHSLSLTGLMPSTLYHFMVSSKDAANNMATSSDMTFTTNALPAADTTAPVISNINASPWSTTAIVSWTTNENASGKVYYGTTTPVNFDTFLSMSNASATTSQSFTLTGLTASTTYYYALVASDVANNTATTSTQSFVTN